MPIFVVKTAQMISRKEKMKVFRSTFIYALRRFQILMKLMIVKHCQMTVLGLKLTLKLLSGWLVVSNQLMCQ